MKNNKKSLSVFLLLMINLATVLSIRNWPVTAMYGYTSIFYLVLSMVFFFIPCALVSAELASLFPKKGGVFVWVKEALGHKLGFLAIWLLWAENVVWYPTILSFISASIAYIFFPAIADNPIYTCLMTIGVFWALTLVNLRGIKFTGKFSAACVIFGTFIPAGLIITLGAIWVLSGSETMLSVQETPFIPDLNSFNTFAVLTGILLGFGGIEMPAIHAADVQNPKKNFPIAILLSAAIIIVLTILGTLCIAMVIPHDDISLVSGTVAAMSVFLTSYNLSWMMPFIAFLIAFGALGGVSNWIVGPCRGLLTAGEAGDFPPFMQKVNINDMPVVIMLMQGVMVTGLSLLFVLMPNVSSSFWLLSVLAAQLYIIMYILLFASAIILRYKKRDMKRSYSVPGGDIGMWVIGGLGLVGVAFTFVIGFFPPPDVQVSSVTFFVSFLAIGILSMVAAPFIIDYFKKPSWKISSKK